VRLFVALRLPAEVVADVAARVDPLTPDWPGLRWVAPEHWHLTLAFLGEVDDRALANLRPRLGRASGRCPPLQLALAGAGSFPRRADRARVVWLGVTGDIAPAGRLAGSVAAAGRRAGLAVDKRPWRAHLTLARSRAQAGVDAQDLVGRLGGYVGSPWQAAQMSLLRSHLGSTVRHEVLDAWELTGRRVPAGHASTPPPHQA
jgi:2'-5' RNA ligase